MNRKEDWLYREKIKDEEFYKDPEKGEEIEDDHDYDRR